MLANGRNDTQHKGLISDNEHNKTAVMLNVIVVSVVRLNVVMLSVVAPAQPKVPIYSSKFCQISRLFSYFS
jgi:hypothetical protein